MNRNLKKIRSCLKEDNVTGIVDGNRNLCNGIVHTLESHIHIDSSRPFFIKNILDPKSNIIYYTYV